MVNRKIFNYKQNQRFVNSCCWNYKLSIMWFKYRKVLHVKVYPTNCLFKPTQSHGYIHSVNNIWIINSPY